MPTRFTRHVAPGTLDLGDRRRLSDQARRTLDPARKLYGQQRWKRLAAAQLAAFPLCKTCESQGRIVPATTCDHVVPHRGNPVLFWEGEMQSLCTNCHSSAKQRDEARGG